ncbi:MAG TPA: TolC family protein [Prolixibacteraceae bacterium]|nr:TolC family protein [Prolixibacteraceae bacterium]HPS14101.1 TolC family protein [Prolixibacteraceae bacterium]
MKTFRIFIILMTCAVFCQAQNILSVEEAVQIALKKNYDIQISRNEATIDKMNNTPGNAGMLPDLSLSGSKNYQLKNVHQELSGGTASDNPNSNTSVLSAGVELGWTVFDGGKMFVTKRKLSEIKALGELQFKEQVMQTIYDVTAAYFNIVKQKQQLNSIEQTIVYNRERVKIMQTSFNSGSVNKADYLQAKIDLNVYLENEVNQQAVIDDAKRNLNRLLGEDIESPIEVNDSIPLGYVPDVNKLKQTLYELNPTVLSFQKQSDISKLALEETKRARLPRINLNGSYIYNNTTNSDGSVRLNRYYGPQVGASLSLPLYEGGALNRKVNVAKMEFSSAQFQLDDIKLQLNTQLQNALNQFETQQKLLEIETENAGLTKENLEISLQRLRLGQTNSLEVHMAQEEFVQSFTRLINFKYNLKLAEIKLKQLMGEL